MSIPVNLWSAIQHYYQMSKDKTSYEFTEAARQLNRLFDCVIEANRIEAVEEYKKTQHIDDLFIEEGE